VDLGLANTSQGDTNAWLLAMHANAGLRWIAFHRTDPVPLDHRVRAGQEAAEYAERVGDFTLEANARRVLSSLLVAHGQVARGLELTRPILDQLDRIDDPRERHIITVLVAHELAWMGGQAQAMVDVLLDALKLGRELRVHDLCHSTGMLINALYVAGRWDEIPGYLEEHLRAFKSDEAGTTCPYALGAFQMGAVVMARRGDVERARELSASMPESQAPIGMTEGLQAMAANALGEHERARELARKVLDTGTRNFAEEPPVELVAMLDALVALEAWDELRDFLPEARRRSSELVLVGPAIERSEALLAGQAAIT
jgi:hypothetical protein